MVRDKLQELGQRIDHDLSGLVYTPLAHVEVHTSTETNLPCLRLHIPHCLIIAAPRLVVQGGGGLLCHAPTSR